MLNNLVGPNGLVPMLLIFGAYPRMTKMDSPLPTITQQTAAVQKAIEDIRRINTKRQVQDALNTRNGPSTIRIHDLPVNSLVLVYRENGSWTGPYKLLSIEGESAIVSLPFGPTKF